MVSKTIRMSEDKWGYVGSVSAELGMSENAFINYLVSHIMGVDFKNIKVGDILKGSNSKVDIIEVTQKDSPNTNKNELPDEVKDELEKLGVKKGLDEWGRLVESGITLVSEQVQRFKNENPKGYKLDGSDKWGYKVIKK
jgi:hypothetical protein